MPAVGCQQLMDLSFDIDVYSKLRNTLGQISGHTGPETGQDDRAIFISDQPLISEVYQ